MNGYPNTRMPQHTAVACYSCSTAAVVSNPDLDRAMRQDDIMVIYPVWFRLTVCGACRRVCKRGLPVLKMYPDEKHHECVMEYESYLRCARLFGIGLTIYHEGQFMIEDLHLLRGRIMSGARFWCIGPRGCGFAATLGNTHFF